MNPAHAEQALRTHLAEVAKKDLAHISLDDDLVLALGLDSLAALRMLATIEKRFGVTFPDDRLGEMRTLRRLLEYTAGATEEGSS